MQALWKKWVAKDVASKVIDSDFLMFNCIYVVFQKLDSSADTANLMSRELSIQIVYPIIDLFLPVRHLKVHKVYK